MSSERDVRRGLLLVIAVAVIFFGSWWNRYAPPTAGGEAVVMAPWADDYLPYRDYFLQAPPGVPILVAAIKAVAGPHLLGTLTFGAFLRIAATCALYALLLAIARPWFAAVAALTALFVSSTDISDTPFYYNHIGASLVLIGTYLSVTGGKGTRGAHQLMTAAGAALIVYAVAVKQTMVFGAAAAVVALVVLLLPKPRAGWIRWLAALCAGGLATVGGMWAWLAYHDLAGTFLFVIRRAPDSKGGVLRSLFRPLLLLSSVGDAYRASTIAWVVLAAGLALWFLHRRGIRVRRDVVLLIALCATMWSLVAPFWSGRIATLTLTALGWWGSLALAALNVGSLGGRQLDTRGRACLALGILSFGIGYCFAVSWPLFENIAFPGLALVVAVLLERPPPDLRRAWVTGVLVFAFAAMCLTVERKFSEPHSWGLWYEPALYTARAPIDHPALAGMRTSVIGAALYTAVAHVAHDRTSPDDQIYVYPNMPILYAIADRRPATYSLAHWVDVCPDFLGPEDAARLRSHPPKLMIIRLDPLGFIDNEEGLYRGGRRSTVKDVVAAIQDLLPRYDRVGIFNSGVSAPIVFLVRRDPPE